jgi:hypothetical protein
LESFVFNDLAGVPARGRSVRIRIKNAGKLKNWPFFRYLVKLAMKFAKYTFLVAGVLGLIALVPQYFLFEKNGTDFPPAINHPEYYYGFIGVAVAFQLVFLVISQDPLKYRAMMMPSVVEKFSFGLACLVLFMQGKLAGLQFAAGAIDLLLGVLFIISWVKAGKTEIEVVHDFEN